MSDSEQSRCECCNCLEVFDEKDLTAINAKESACPECHRAIMRDFRACDQRAPFP